MPSSRLADMPHERRHRRPEQSVAGHPDIPVYERPSGTAHGTGRNAAMGRVLRMDTTGLWVVWLGGELAEIGGRSYWESLGDLTAAARRAGIPLSDLTIRTGWNA